MPYAAAGDALRGAGDVTGKTIVDISKPVTPDYSGLALGFTTSAAEEIQKAVPTAKVVKAFNTTFARVLGAAPDRTRAQVLYAGDDAGVKAAVRALIESAGFGAVMRARSPTRGSSSRAGCSTFTSATPPAAGPASRPFGSPSPERRLLPVTFPVTNNLALAGDRRRPAVDFSGTYASGRWPSLASGGSGARGRAFESRRAHSGS